MAAHKTNEENVARLAIVTRTKNRPVLLKRALESIVDQSVQDYVHIVLNDGGDQRQFDEVISQLPDARRVVLNNKTSVGLIPALNQAIRACKSEYICILDDDDSWHEDRVKLVLDYFDKHPATKACVVKMDIVVEDIVDNEVVRIDQYLHPDSGDGEISLFKQCARNYISNGIVTYRKAVYDELGGYDENLETAEDWDFGVRLLSRYDVDLIPSVESLFFYHQRPDIKDENGNSVHAGIHDQEVAINRVRNKYLREDIMNGRYGVGCIMNQVVADMSNVVRIEGHINRAEERIVNRVDNIYAMQKRTHDKLLHSLVARAINRSGLKKYFKKESH